MRLWKGKDRLGVDSSLPAPLVLSQINPVLESFHLQLCLPEVTVSLESLGRKHICCLLSTKHATSPA